MAIGVKNVSKSRKHGFLESTYIIPILQGLVITLKHMFKKKAVLQYPEEKKVMPPGYRGLHMLTRDTEGRVKCVACEMCSTACPSDCIRIVADDGGWEDSREKYPKTFEIDMLRCIFCGMCVEACPEDAIDMTDMHNLADFTRQDFIYGKERLINNYDEYAKDHPEFLKRKDSSIKAMRNSSEFPVKDAEHHDKGTTGH